MKYTQHIQPMFTFKHALTENGLSKLTTDGAFMTCSSTSFCVMGCKKRKKKYEQDYSNTTHVSCRNTSTNADHARFSLFVHTILLSVPKSKKIHQ